MVIFAGQKYNYHQLAPSFCFSSLQLTAGIDICYLLTDKAVIQESSAELDTSCFKSDGFSAQTCVLQPSPCMDEIHPHLPWLQPGSGTGEFASPMPPCAVQPRRGAHHLHGAFALASQA